MTKTARRRKARRKLKLRRWGFTSSRTWYDQKIAAGEVVAKTEREAKKLAKEIEVGAPRIFVWDLGEVVPDNRKSKQYAAA